MPHCDSGLTASVPVGDLLASLTALTWPFFWKAHYIDETYPRRHTANPQKRFTGSNLTCGLLESALALAGRPGAPNLNTRVSLCMRRHAHGRAGPWKPAEGPGPGHGLEPPRTAQSLGAAEPTGTSESWFPRACEPRQARMLAARPRGSEPGRWRPAGASGASCYAHGRCSMSSSTPLDEVVGTYLSLKRVTGSKPGTVATENQGARLKLKGLPAEVGGSNNPLEPHV